MNLKLDHLHVCHFKGVLKREFAKNTSDTIKYSMALIPKEKEKQQTKTF